MEISHFLFEPLLRLACPLQVGTPSVQVKPLPAGSRWVPCWPQASRERRAVDVEVMILRDSYGKFMGIHWIFEGFMFFIQFYWVFFYIILWNLMEVREILWDFIGCFWILRDAIGYKYYIYIYSYLYLYIHIIYII